jgi:hypothetical protein
MQNFLYYLKVEIGESKKLKEATPDQIVTDF